MRTTIVLAALGIGAARFGGEFADRDFGPAAGSGVEGFEQVMAPTG